jgi:hypothetical protein
MIRGAVLLPRPRGRIAILAALALALAGCSGNMFDKNEGGFFSKPMDLFNKPDWSKPAIIKDAMNFGGPVGPDELVGADGRCATPVAQAPQPAAPAQPAAATPADEPAPAAPAATPATPASTPAADAGAAPVLGGIALGMTECQTVARAGVAGGVNISAGAKGERAVVLTYLSGPWPGIYHFSNGRLKEIDRAPEPPPSAKPPPKKKATKKKPANAKTSQGSTSITVQ